jgi:hypothetical protein
MAGIGSFNSQLKAFAKDVRDRHANKVKRTATAVQRAAYQSTPIDTSRAMSGWRSQVNAPYTGQVSYVPGFRGSTMGEAYASNEANIQDVSVSYKFGQSVYVTNNVPYILILDEGGINRAPAGMSSLALQAGLREMKK